MTHRHSEHPPPNPKKLATPRSARRKDRRASEWLPDGGAYLFDLDVADTDHEPAWPMSDEASFGAVIAELATEASLFGRGRYERYSLHELERAFASSVGVSIVRFEECSVPSLRKYGSELIYERLVRACDRYAVKPPLDELRWASMDLAPQPAHMSAKTELEDARREVVQDPDDDAARRRFAKAARNADQTDRADLIEAQLRSAKNKRKPGDSTRVRSLLATYGPEWAREDLGEALFKRVRGRWRRGFLEWVELDAATFVAHASELFDRLPVRGIRITSLENSSLAELLEVEQLGRVRALSLQELGIDDAAARALASAPVLRALRWLDLSNNAIGDEGVRALIASPHLQDVYWVGLHDNPSRLPPRPGGREGNLVLTTKWSQELRRREDLPAWVARNAELEAPRWFEV